MIPFHSDQFLQALLLEEEQELYWHWVLIYLLQDIGSFT